MASSCRPLELTRALRKAPLKARQTHSLRYCLAHRIGFELLRRPRTTLARSRNPGLVRIHHACRGPPRDNWGCTPATARSWSANWRQTCAIREIGSLPARVFHLDCACCAFRTRQRSGRDYSPRAACHHVRRFPMVPCEGLWTLLARNPLFWCDCRSDGADMLRYGRATDPNARGVKVGVGS